MKRCGQWLVMLWVSAALLYPQAATAASPAHDRIFKLSPSQVQSLPLLADCSFKETGKVDAKPSTTADNSEQIQGDNDLHLSRPAISGHSPYASTPVQPAIEETRGRLPFACGPPVRS